MDNQAEQTARTCIFSKLALTSFSQLDAEERDAFIERQIAALVSSVASAFDEVGCRCLAQKLLGLRADQLEDCCALGQDSRDRPSLLLTVKLAPLTRALAAAGYYDYALVCVEAAMSLEPTWDLNLFKAYLLLALGDTGEACEIYRRAVLNRRGIPEAEIRRLAQLANEHGEDDIIDIYRQVVQLQADRTA